MNTGTLYWKSDQAKILTSYFMSPKLLTYSWSALVISEDKDKMKKNIEKVEYKLVNLTIMNIKTERFMFNSWEKIEIHCKKFKV